jgi:integrase
MEDGMKARFHVVQRGDRDGMCYCKDTLTGARLSLDTKDRSEAERIVQHKNETLKNPGINHRIGMVYLSASDPQFATRNWRFVMDDIIKDKKGKTLKRYLTALKDPAFKLIEKKLLVETLASDFLDVLRAGTVCTNVYLRRFQNYAVDMDWLPKRVLPKRLIPKVKHKDQRAITRDEHQRILKREGNAERRDFYELCWYFGGSQSDIASLRAEDLDYVRRGFSYERLKNSSLSGCRIGPKAWEVILRRPRTGPLFPYLINIREGHRATEFKQRCDGLGIIGVTLHSYRYAWAERSADNAYPERYAQRVLGQNSKIIHRAYAKKAQKELPALEEYEEAVRQAEESGKILVLKPETELPVTSNAKDQRIAAS